MAAGKNVKPFAVKGPVPSRSTSWSEVSTQSPDERRAPTESRPAPTPATVIVVIALLSWVVNPTVMGTPATASSLTLVGVLTLSTGFQASGFVALLPGM